MTSKNVYLNPLLKERILQLQGGGCGVCGSKERKLVLDHDHMTNLIRGYLCQGCNTALGKLGDNLDGLLKAVAYLLNHERRLSDHRRYGPYRVFKNPQTAAREAGTAEEGS